jgi:hypothetical protein
VVFFADEARARLLLAIVQRHDLRLSMTNDGLLDLGAGSVSELQRMAAEVLDWCDTFDALPGPATASLRGSDGYWVHDLEELGSFLRSTRVSPEGEALARRGAGQSDYGD